MSDNENKFDDCFCKLHEKIKDIEIKTDDDVIDISGNCIYWYP